MNVFSSLTNRIFVATALLAVLSIAIAVYIVNRGVTKQAQSELQRGLDEAAGLVDQSRKEMFESFAREATLIADLPLLKAAVDTGDPATLEPIARDYRQLLPNADLFAIADNKGQVLVRLGATDVPNEAIESAATKSRMKGVERDTSWPEEHDILLIKSVPIWIDRRQPDVLGTLILGARLGYDQANRLKNLTSSEIAFGVGNTVQVATLPAETWPALAGLLSHPGRSSLIDLGGEEYLATVSPLGPSGAHGQPMAIVLRSQTARLRFLSKLHAQFAGTAVLAVLAAILLSYGIARTVTRPLEAITSTMREMTASADLTRRIPVAPDARWQDEDARLLATTFNAMTDAIARFQRESTQRERLSSLGRLSTIIAHEIRNPLMILKASVRLLRRDEVSTEQLRTAARDIDEEITRLNRIVTEVLDFARPIKFDLAPADLNALAQDAVRAAGTGEGRVAVRLDLDPDLPAVLTDNERLRQVLVNIVGNAMQAVAARDYPAEGHPIQLRTARIDGRVVVTVADKGTGIAPEDLPRVFDPFFTTRRTGTGIGLAISRNIIEGLGGRITVSSQRDRGTDVRIELPVDSATV